jgi:glucosamine-6-phosphate deaminase
MGIATILDSRRVTLLATGAHKAAAVRDAIEGPLSARCQASALQTHERATFIIDEAAASCLEYRDYFRWANSENTPIIEKFGNFYELDQT